MGSFSTPPVLLCGFLSLETAEPLKFLSRAEAGSPCPPPLSGLLVYSWLGMLDVLYLVIFLTSWWKKKRRQENLSHFTLAAQGQSQVPRVPAQPRFCACSWVSNFCIKQFPGERDLCRSVPTPVYQGVLPSQA